jgi:hypothetical protein
LEDRNSPGSDLGFGTINVERREGPEFQRTLIALVAGFGGLQRPALHIQAVTSLNDTPILVNNIKDRVAYLRFECCSGLENIAPTDYELCRVGKHPSIAKERLTE